MPAKEQKSTKTRASVDDQRRVYEQYNAVAEFADGIVAIGVEAYSIGRAMGGNAWKTVFSYQNICSFGYANGIPVYPAIPSDIKKLLLGKAHAKKGETQGKLEVIAKVTERVEGLASAMGEYAPGKWEHLADAVAHAILVLEKLESDNNG